MARHWGAPVSAHLGVEGALQRRLFAAVADGGAGPVLQQHLDDPLVAPAGRHVQRRVALVVLQVQVARLHVVVHQRLHALTRDTHIHTRAHRNTQKSAAVHAEVKATSHISYTRTATEAEGF